MSRPGGVNLPPDFDPKDPIFRKFANKLPTRETCDLGNPKEMFLWMLVALPGVNGGHQVMPSSYNMLVSEHLFQCGAMLTCPQCGYTKQPEKAYVAPTAEDPHWLTSPGRWVEPDQVPKPKEGEDAIDAAIDAMPPMVRAALFNRMKERQKGGEL